MTEPVVLDESRPCAWSVSYYPPSVGFFHHDSNFSVIIVRRKKTANATAGKAFGAIANGR
jgi:hypothetical protein